MTIPFSTRYDTDTLYRLIINMDAPLGIAVKVLGHGFNIGVGHVLQVGSSGFLREYIALGPIAASVFSKLRCAAAPLC